MSAEHTLKGTLEFQDLGAGVWTLVTEDGTRWALIGVVPADMNGRQVEISGVESTQQGTAMTGPALEIRAIRSK